MVNQDIEPSKRLASLGVQAFLIISTNGHPIVERIYRPTEIDEKEVADITPVIIALIKFANDLTEGRISDLGVHTSRLYFDFFSDVILVILFDENRLLNVRLSDIQVLLKGTLSDVKDVFIVYLSEMDINAKDLLSYKDKLADLGTNIDEILFKSIRRALEFIDIDFSLNRKL